MRRRFCQKREGGGDPPPFSDRKTTYSRPTNVDQSRGGRDERERKGRNRRAEEEEEGDEKHEISRILARGEKFLRRAQKSPLILLFKVLENHSCCISNKLNLQKCLQSTCIVEYWGGKQRVSRRSGRKTYGSSQG